MFENRATIHRATKNPLDKSTIVSIYPRDIDINNFTLFPGKFKFPAAKAGDFTLLTIGSSSCFREMQDSPDTLEIVVGSMDVAGGLIKDWSDGYLECDMDTKRPGLFFIPGDFNKVSIQKWVNPTDPLDTFQKRLEIAKEWQKNLFLALVNLADKFWVAGGGNPAAVPQLSRMAAEYLGIEAKEWLKNYQAIDLIKCVACGSMRNPDYPVCPNCKAVIDPEKAKSLKLIFAA